LLHKIDGIDAKILKDLLRDGRRNFSDIGEECGVSTNLIRKRFARMVKDGIIVGATVLVDYKCLNYMAIASLHLNVESQHVENALERLKQISNLLAIRQFNSRYGIRLIARLKSLQELERIKETIRLHNSVIDLRTYFWLDVRNTLENLSLGIAEGQNQKVSEKVSKTSGSHKIITVDETDLAIVEKLSQNGRLSFRRLSEQIGMSTDTIIRRYERLVDSGCMKVTIQINPEKLGYCAILDFSIAFAFQQETDAILENLSKIPDVIIILKTSGDYDLHVTAMARDTEQQFRIQEEIAKIPNIARLETAARRIPSEWPTRTQHISTF
jgi:Lrp/AsnC family transcriptional regulator for asnA, asnC and gidA